MPAHSDDGRSSGVSVVLPAARLGRDTSYETACS
jgi:hypothetical protein